jgi:tetratricopeptide (TPR) repeat protein/tRNA A-37 threonylcarbamoyl transferase component Bud32/GGDEF domain-containing protein
MFWAAVAETAGMERMQEFGRYQLMDRIGAGGMAEVYLARHLGAEGLEKLVVIKRIRPEHAQKPRFITMFIDEAKIAVSLNHPNIAQVYEFGRFERDFFLAMEYVEGVDLARLLGACRKVGLALPVEDVIYVGIEVCKALDYAHRKRDKFDQPLGIVHRDISPQNILLSRDGGVKLLDFGIAKAAHVQEGEGELRGKYSYMSPEQARAEAVDARADLFALGAVLWELLTGEVLFPYTSAEETLVRVRAAQVPSLRSLRPEVPEALEAILGRALCARPEGRYEDARALQVALTRCLFQWGQIADSVTLAGFLQRVEGALPLGSRLIMDGGAVGQGTQVPEGRGAAPEARGEALLDQFDGDGELQSQITESPEGQETQDRGVRRAEGTQVAGPQQTPTGALRLQTERKECVLVCGDLRGFNALRGLIGVERWRQVLMDTIRIVEAVAYKNQALVDRVDEHGFALLLGLPISSENDAERALGLAQDLVEAVDAINLNLESPLQLSLGIVVGAAVLEYPEQAGTRAARRAVEKFEWFYDAEAPGRGGLHIAEALAQAALPREILVGGRVFRRVRSGYHGEPIAPVEVDVGAEEPVRVAPLRVLGPKGSREQMRELRHGYRRLLGRELELKELREEYRKTRLRSRGQGVLLVGEKGVGKSTLVQEFVHGLQGAEGEPSELLVFRGAAELTDKDTVYGSLAVLLLEMLGLGRGADLRETRAQLLGLREGPLKGLPAREQERVLHALAFVLGVKLERENLLEGLEPEERQAALFGQLRAFLSRLSARKPLLFAIEDMQNVDGASLAFLADYLSQRPSDPVFFVMTALPVEAEGAWGALLEGRGLRVMALRELDPAASRALAEALLPDELAQEEALVGALVARTGGNPLYIKELVELIEARSPQPARELLLQLEARGEEGGWIPSTVEGLVINRIDRLAPDARKTLQRCGVLGHSFGEELVRAVLVGFSGGDVEGELGRLGRLVEARLLVRLDRGEEAQEEGPRTRELRRRYQDRAPAEARGARRVWGFANSVIREVAARSLVEPELGELHGALAEYLLSRGGDLLKKDVVSIAHHLDAAGEDERAGEMYLVAALQAMESLGGDASLRLVERALERVPRGGRSYRSGLELKERALGLLGRPQERGEVLEELLGLLGEDAEGARKRLQVRARQLRLLFEQGALEAVEAQAQEALSQARALGERAAVGSALRLLHMVYRDTGRHEEAEAAIGESVGCFRAAGDTEGLWASLVSRGIAQRQRGLLREALGSYQEALEIVEGRGFRRQELTTRTNLGLLYVNLGEYDLAWERYQVSLEEAQELGYLRDEAGILMNFGHLQLRLGDLTRAHKMLVNGIRLARKARDKMALVDGLISLGLVHVARERHREAEALLRQGLELAQEISNLYLEAHARMGLAQVWLECAPEQRRPAEALEMARAAQRRGAEAGVGWMQAGAGSLCAEALAAQGDAEGALSESRAAVLRLGEPLFDGAEAILQRHARLAVSLAPEEARAASARAQDQIERWAAAIKDPQRRRRYRKARGV